MFESIRKAKQTVADVEKWGKESAEYQHEQKVKRGEAPQGSKPVRRRR